MPERTATTVSAAPRHSGQGWLTVRDDGSLLDVLPLTGSTMVVTGFLEDQANTCGIVHDVGIIYPLAHCRPGLTGMVATRGAYRARQRSVLAILPIGAY
jgi:hypothetical protein